MESKHQTILIVDDMPSNIEILNNILSDEYEILFATSGKDTLDIAANHIPDLILLDVVMPDMDGYQVLAKLKASEKTRDIPVVFVTSMGSEEDESKGLNLGAIDYITKPIVPSIVKARIRNHLELKQYRDTLKVLSTIDGLTGIPNHRTFEEALENEWRRARRMQTPLSLCMLDIDNFKAYNDHYGHLSGDDCLHRLGAVLASVIRRPADLVARYGGEEFVILLPDTDTEGARITAERVQEKVNLMNIKHEYSTVANHITLSTGIATLVPTDNEGSPNLVERADKMLYKAKANGRNQIQVWS